MTWPLNGSNKQCVLSIMPKISENLIRIEMERSVAVSSNWNIQDHLWRWSTYFGRNMPTGICCSIFDKAVLCSIREFGKGKNWQKPFLFGGPVSSENVVAFSLGIPTYL